MRLFLLALLFATTASAQPLYGPLTPGPYAVGFRVIERYDYSRPYRFARDLSGKPRSGELARPMQISVWYPAEKGSGKAMRFGDYVALVASATKFAGISDADRANAERLFFGFPIINEVSEEQRGRWKGMETWARADAKPAAGRFPLVIWSFFWPALGHVTPEYLASRGYVVVTMPRVDSTTGAGDRAAPDLYTKALDMDFLINEMASHPAADIHNIGAIGFSAGGHWALGEAMRNPDVHAVVSLDTIMLYHDAVGQAFAAMPFYGLDRVRIPVLHMIRSVWVPNEDQALWTKMRYADRTYLEFVDPALDHFDFQSAGYATTALGARPNAARASAAAHELYNRYTLAFLDTHLKGDAAARAFLARSPEENGAPSGFVKVSRLAAVPPKPSPAEFFAAMNEEGVDAALTAYPAVAPLPEATLNTAGYQLFFARRVADAVKVFTLMAESYPQSANAHDSLADALEAAGEKARAIAESEKALALLDGDASLAPDRKELVRKNIQDKLARLRK